MWWRFEKTKMQKAWASWVPGWLVLLSYFRTAGAVSVLCSARQKVAASSRWAAMQNSDRTRVLEVVSPVLCSRPDARVSSARLEAPAILLPLCHSGWDYSCVQDHTQYLCGCWALNFGPDVCRAMLLLLICLSGPHIQFLSFSRVWVSMLRAAGV